MKKRIHLTETGNFHIGETDVDEKCTKWIRVGITFHRYYPHSMKSCVRYLCRASAHLQISSLSFALFWTVLNALFTRIAIERNYFTESLCQCTLNVYWLLIIFINVTYITENDKLFHYNTKGKQDRSSLLSRLQKLCQWGWYNGTDNNQGIGRYGFFQRNTKGYSAESA